MSKLSLDNSGKFKSLLHTSKMPRPYLRGLLDSMWSAAHSSSPVLGSAERVEVCAEWPGEAGQWFNWMRTDRWIEELQPGVWRIKDYFDHCPEYVIKRIAYSRGIPYKGLRPVLIEEYRKEIESFRIKSNPRRIRSKKIESVPDLSCLDQTRPDLTSPLSSPPATTEIPLVAATIPIPKPIDTPAISAAWMSFLRHRSEMQRAVTLTSAKTMLADLEKAGPSKALAILERSLSSGYTGLIFDDKPNAKPKGSDTSGIDAGAALLKQAGFQ